MRVVWTSLAACVVGAICAAPAASTSAATGNASPPLALHECLLQHPLKLASIGARCGHLRVAQDPAHPRGGTIDLSVAVIPALNRRSDKAPLFVLAGGPGQAATDLYVSYASAFAPANRNHDIVLLDQRGTGKSQPLVCSYPDDWRESDEVLAQVREATVACLNKYGERVRFYTSSVAVGDLEQVRRALRYGKIDLYGSSYGTRMAELYMRRFPASTHAVVLDGVTDPQQPIGPDIPYDGERALDLILERCAASPECAAAFPELRRDVEVLRRRFGPEKSVLTMNDPSSGLPLEIEFGRGMLSAALRFLSYSATQASLLPTLIHQAALGRLEPLAAQTIMMAREVGDQLAIGMQMSVICSEDVPFFVEPLDRAGIARTYQGTDQLDALGEICAMWPRGPVDADLHAALHSAIPSLLLSGEADPVTPPSDADRLARSLERYRHLVLKGEGHGQLATGCVPKLLAAFLDRADPNALDASCLERQRPAPFFVSLTGPAP